MRTWRLLMRMNQDSQMMRNEDYPRNEVLSQRRKEVQWAPHEILKSRFYVVNELISRGRILKELSRPCPLGSKFIRFGGFQKGAVCLSTSRSC